MADLAAMVQPFADEELHTFQGAGGKQLTYIEDETVMDRLDLGFGPGNWSIHVEPIPYVEGVVKVKLSVRVDGSPSWVEYEDFGYPNNTGATHQLLKEAVSDGIRRCGRYLGIARDLYRKDSPPVVRAPQINGQHGGELVAASTPLRTHTGHRDGNPGAASDRPVPARSSTAVPEPPLEWDVLSDKKPESFAVTQAGKQDPDGSWTYPQLADRAKALGVPVKALGDTSRRLFGKDAWKLTDLSGPQRYAIAVEEGLL